MNIVTSITFKLAIPFWLKSEYRTASWIISIVLVAQVVAISAKTFGLTPFSPAATQTSS